MEQQTLTRFMAEKLSLILKAFKIPQWYGDIMCQEEKEKLWNCIKEATCAKDARFLRVLDCSAYCVEGKCYFCGEFAKQKIEK